ncbi:MAG: Ribulose-phosphate 3-epimerase [Candidatus Anoxychlamydiales bacterium]|nr:Ribulose-phosphate 3-epimerase [Candidatus Anoxychlamydiales bacterium]
MDVKKVFFMSKKIKVAPSLLAADFSNLEKELKKIEKSKADALHLDIMDGHFVPNFSMGPKIVGTVNKLSDIFLDVHLMIYNPYDYVEKFIEQGADMITFHVEATEDIEDTLNYIKKCSKKVGLALNPKTSFSLVERYLELIDVLLIMSVNPGFGGQKFIESTLKKIDLAKKIKDENKLKYEIQVDGGIDDIIGKKCVQKGADFLVAGTYLFSQSDMQKGVEKLKSL